MSCNVFIYYVRSADEIIGCIFHENIVCTCHVASKYISYVICMYVCMHVCMYACMYVCMIPLL